MAFSKFPVNVEIDWSQVENTPSTFPSSWDNVSNKPVTFPSDWSAITGKPNSYPTDWNSISGKPPKFTPTDNINVVNVSCDELTVTNPIGGNSHIGYGTNADIYLSTGMNGVLRHRRFDGSNYPVNVDIWTEENFDPTTKADINHTHDFLPTLYNSTTDPDITGLIPASRVGDIVKARNNAHFVIGLQNNDERDSFNIIGTDFSLSDNQPYTRKYFRVSDALTEIRVGHGSTGGNPSGTFEFLSGGELSIRVEGKAIAIKNNYNYGEGFSTLEFYIDGQKVMSVNKSGTTGGRATVDSVLAESITTERLTVKDELIMTALPTFANARTNEIYVDSNGFLKRK